MNNTQRQLKFTTLHTQPQQQYTKTKISLTSNNLHHSQQYNQLLNLRTTLLHMQYLYCQLDKSLENQHKNQQNQHKDHLIQCYNMKQEYEEIKKNNFNQLFIIKLQEVLALEEDNNQRLIQQNFAGKENKNNMSTKSNKLQQNIQAQFQQFTKPSSQQQIYEQVGKQYEILSKLDKFLTYIKIKEQQMQQFLCKLYVGNKVMIDLDKVTQKIEKIEKKIDSFMEKNTNTILEYNQRSAELEQTKEGFKKYLNSVQKELQEMSKNKQEMQPKASKASNLELYEQHIRNKLISQEQYLEKVIQIKKSNLLNF